MMDGARRVVALSMNIGFRVYEVIQASMLHEASWIDSSSCIGPTASKLMVCISRRSQPLGPCRSCPWHQLAKQPTHFSTSYFIWGGSQ